MTFLRVLGVGAIQFADEDAGFSTRIEGIGLVALAWNARNGKSPC